MGNRLGREHPRIKLKANARDTVDPNAGSQLPAYKRRRSLQGAHRLLGVVRTAEWRYKHHRLPKIGRNRYPLNRYEADGRIIEPSLDQITDFTRDLGFDPLRTARSDDAASGATGAVLRCGWPR